MSMQRTKEIDEDVKLVGFQPKLSSLVRKLRDVQPVGADFAAAAAQERRVL